MSLLSKGIAFAAAIGLSQAVTTAASATDFYANKRITIVCGAGVGGGYDLYSRLLAEYMAKHVPGHPTIIVENRTGAGTRVASTYVYRNAAKDGTVIANSVNLLPFDQVMFPDEQRQYDLTRVQFIGNMAALTGVIAVATRTGVTSIEDVKSKTVVLGANSRFSETYIMPTVLNELSGMKFKVVQGFPGSANEIDIAIERGEVDGRGGSWSSFRVGRADWVRDGKIKPILQIGIAEDAFMKGVPRLLDLAQTEEQKAIYGALSRGSLFSRAFWVAPEVPKERVEILRKAFMDTMKDPDFLATANKRRFDITPSTGLELNGAMGTIRTLVGGLNPEYAKRLRNILRGRSSK